MKKEIRYLIKARLRDILSEIAQIDITLEIAEFSIMQGDWLEMERKYLVELKEEQKSLKEALCEK